MKVEIYSDIACPWCYIGEKRFASALAEFAQADQVEVVFRPYQLNPDASPAPAPLMKELEKKFGARAPQMLAQVGSVAKAEGIDMNWDDAIGVNTLTAHRLLRLAETEYGVAAQHSLMEKLFDAYFTNGGNVADHALLADLAVASGLDRDRVESYLASNEGLAEVKGEIAQAQRIGVRAVPTFVFEGKSAVEGAQSPAVFLQVLEEVQQELAAATPAASEAGLCVDGSCSI